MKGRVGAVLRPMSAHNTYIRAFLCLYTYICIFHLYVLTEQAKRGSDSLELELIVRSLMLVLRTELRLSWPTLASFILVP